MAVQKISEMTSATVLLDEDIIPILQSNTNKKITVSLLRDYNKLKNMPSINGVTLVEDKKLNDLNIIESNQGIIINSNTKKTLKLDPPTDLEMETRANVNKPITVKTADKMAKETAHQEMSDTYNPNSQANLTQGESQPVSYKAAKQYIEEIKEELNNEINLKAPTNSPTFTGTPKAPDVAKGTNNTQIANTAYVQTELLDYIKKNQGTNNSGKFLGINEQGLVENKEVSIESLGGQHKDFIVNITILDDQTTVTADKTYIEITEANSKGRNCYAIIDGGKVPFIGTTSEGHFFSTVIYNGSSTIIAYIQIALNNVVIFYFKPFEPPMADSFHFGGVKVNPKLSIDNDYTVPILIDEEGFLWGTQSSSGGNGGDNGGIDVRWDEEQQAIIFSDDGADDREEKESTDTAVTILPNKLYVFPEMTTLNVTLATPTSNVMTNEYHFFFISGATATTFSLVNQDGSQIYSDTYSIEANMKYEVSILENVAYIKGVSISGT